MHLFAVMIQMAVLISLGIVWQKIAPNHMPVESHRRALTDLVFFILLPALVMDVMWQAPLNINTLKLSVTAVSTILLSLLLMWVILRMTKVSRAQKGALLIAATFPNSTYLGLPVTAQAFGEWSQAIVLQYDLFACTPLVLTLGVLIANHFGESKAEIHPFQALLKVPPLWALAIASLLNVANIPQPDSMHQALSILGGGVVPLMLIVLGMSIRLHTLTLSNLPLLLPVCIIALLVAPVLAYSIANSLQVPTDHLRVAVILAAMPTMIFGIVLCERYHLDSGLYAAAVFVTTLVSIASLTVWFDWL